ncbi:class I SAM-dependent methyltransferase [Arcobacter arenosus]|uniref:Class I SAM-dependent methyltransferase n=1 Tax=Arcobacter arenosus TaxID=2576037 RepID=A0A5R8XZV7_9BACT|nr:class I SAM-dependent methyltransferase [Arcobacter arenosus]TLP37779.1 class I SAM-dependent methyltransferase [Arcobacter arenosus]
MKNAYNEKYYLDINEQTVSSMESKYTKFLSYIQDDINPSEIADLGCGSGTLCAFLKKQYPNSNVVGLDAFEIPLTEAKNKYKNITFLKCNLENEKFPFEDNSIDLLVSHEVIEHLQSLENYLSESYRVLKPKGIILFKTPNRLDIMRVISPLFGKKWYADLDETHIKYYDIFNLQFDLKKYSFQQIKTYTGTKPLLKKRYINIPALPIIGNGLIVIAKK